MGIKLSELELGSSIIVLASNDDGSIEFKANLIKHIKENLAVVSIDVEGYGMLNFDNVKIEIEYIPIEGIPVIWRTAAIHVVNGQYIIQVAGEAVKNNRRGCFRVGVSKIAKIKVKGKGEKETMVRDVSLSGFGLTDRKKELMLKMGDEVVVYFNDAGHSLNLAGRLVRIDETEEFFSYGFSITNICKDLSSYISVKQRQHRAQQQQQ